MSTERPDNDVTGPRRRRPPLAVASVAAAVLLAGGGGAYWASTAAGDGGAADSGASARKSAPLLALDASADSPGRTAPDSRTSPDSPPPGIAPGEPDPGGPPVVYRAAGELPDGPDEAAVHHARGTVASADVARLAKALGIPGSPRTEGTSWVVGDDDGPGALLKVTKQAPGTWTFARTTPPKPCESGTMCANGASEPGGDPVSEKVAKAAAVPVLKAAGQDDAALNAGQLMGDVRVVNADPKIDGLPTYGWSTGVQVGPDGEVTGGSGHLKALEKGDTYPAVGADEALKQLNAASRGKGDADRDIGGCATPVPLEGEPKPSDPQCVPSNGKRAPVEQTVEDAVFGLALNYVDGRQTLVPSWLFTVRQAPGGPENTVTQVAVDPKFIEKPDAPTPSGDRKVTSYGADGRTLEVTFWGGVCSTYTASAKESAGQVRISVTEKPQEGKKACIMIAKELTRTVTLEKPLGDRTVIDAASGGAVPRA
ncbi:hypothetical protein [Streptomyces anulatus]|uniref:hypothetical protein n=1 Tax=Streptomyces anulatus TaxID=1892 RepID=UPI00255CE178|nr:hypothetical protein [Streptomyces anulatus]WIY75723.1 hypothetical protein QPM16_08460 [Streptomyces anulatus]